MGEVAKYRNGKAHENDISEHGEYVVVNSKFVSTDGEVCKFSNKQIEPLYKDEIAFVLSDVPNGRAIARTFLVDKNDKYTLNQRIAGITPAENVCPYFLHILMNRNIYFLQFDDGAKQTNLSITDVMEFEEYYPSNEEQNRIGRCFENLDRLITLHQRKLDKLINVKKSMLEKMFPKQGSTVPEIRFTGFTNDWEQRKLNEFTKYSSSSLTVKDIDETASYDLYDANEEIGKTDKSPLFDDYISIIKDGAGVGRVRKLPKNTSVLGTMGAIIPQNSDYNFLFSILEKTDFTKLTSGGTIPHIYYNQYGEKVYSIPTLEEQQKIGQYFRNLDNLITLHQRVKSLKTDIITRKGVLNNGI